MEFKSGKIKAETADGLKEFLEAKGENWLDWESRAIVTVDFRSEIEARSWGIKSLLSFATHVDGLVEIWKGEEGEPGFREINIPVKASLLDSSEWKIEDDIKPQAEGELLSVTQVTINIHTKKIYVA